MTKRVRAFQSILAVLSFRKPCRFSESWNDFTSRPVGSQPAEIRPAKNVDEIQCWRIELLKSLDIKVTVC